jgi:hypothetical protein
MRVSESWGSTKEHHRGQRVCRRFVASIEVIWKASIGCEPHRFNTEQNIGFVWQAPTLCYLHPNHSAVVLSLIDEPLIKDQSSDIRQMMFFPIFLKAA